MNKIGIWAPLRYANYGDDMQAIAIAKLLQNNGYNVKLFQLDESLAKHYDLEVANSVDALCRDIKLCIIAGGGLLTPLNIAKRYLKKEYHEYEQDFCDLYSASKKYDVKFCAISMGGDGKSRSPYLYYGKGRRDFFASQNFLNGTVRLEGDIVQMKKFSKTFVYYPDMLFRSSDYFEPILLPSTSKYRVGINFKKGKYLDESLVNDIIEYAHSHDDIEFHFVTTHLEKKGLNYQYLPNVESNNIFIDRYTSPNQLFGVLASMDIFITSMLHLGLTGLSMKTPFLCYRGPGKTKSFLNSIGGDWAIVDDHISFSELHSLYFSQNREKLYEQYNIEKLNLMMEQSSKHYDFCLDIASKFA